MRSLFQHTPGLRHLFHFRHLPAGLASKMLVALATISLSAPALAYLDPGSGSAIMSAIIGFVVAVSMGVKSYWYKIKSWFTGNKEVAAEPSAGNSDGNDTEQTAATRDSADSDADAGQ